MVKSNHYSNQDLYIAKEFHEVLQNYLTRKELKDLPFARQIDAWWLALCIGVKIKQRTPLPENKVKFNDGSILDTDPWRLTHLELIALSENNEEILNAPKKVIRIANEYANTGFEWITNKIVGDPDASLTLLHSIKEFIEESD